MSLAGGANPAGMEGQARPLSASGRGHRGPPQHTAADSGQRARPGMGWQAHRPWCSILQVEGASGRGLGDSSAPAPLPPLLLLPHCPLGCRLEGGKRSEAEGRGR